MTTSQHIFSRLSNAPSHLAARLLQDLFQDHRVGVNMSPSIRRPMFHPYDISISIAGT
jgi:hypothetical protein